MITTEVDVYELDGNECGCMRRPKIKILSHWNSSDKIILHIKRHKYGVFAADLIKAITNAQNHD